MFRVRGIEPALRHRWDPRWHVVVEEMAVIVARLLLLSSNMHVVKDNKVDFWTELNWRRSDGTFYPLRGCNSYEIAVHNPTFWTQQPYKLPSNLSISRKISLSPWRSITLFRWLPGYHRGESGVRQVQEKKREILESRKDSALGMDGGGNRAGEGVRDRDA